MPARTLPAGILIAFEGIDGAGKTTQARLLGDRLRDLGFEVVETKEPTDGPWGQRIRRSATEGRLAPEDELRFFIEDRREHVEQLIAPALEAGKFVIVDRYYYSTAAYQGARGADPDDLIDENERFAPRPALVFLLEVDPRLGLSRISKRGDEANLFEREDLLAQSAAIFSKIGGSHVVRLDGRASIDEVEAQVVSAVAERPLFRTLCSKRIRKRANRHTAPFTMPKNAISLK